MGLMVWGASGVLVSLGRSIFDGMGSDTPPPCFSRSFLTLLGFARGGGLYCIVLVGASFGGMKSMNERARVYAYCISLPLTRPCVGFFPRAFSRSLFSFFMRFVVVIGYFNALSSPLPPPLRFVEGRRGSFLSYLPHFYSCS